MEIEKQVGVLMVALAVIMFFGFLFFLSIDYDFVIEWGFNCIIIYLMQLGLTVYWKKYIVNGEL